MSGKPPNKLSHAKISDLSTFLVNTAKQIPIEFVRKPRSLYEVKRFKATEFRQFLCYTGPVVLKFILPVNMYVNFLSFHLAIRILPSPYLIREHIEYAQSLLQYFVETYARECVTQNVHNLLHLCNDAIKFGVLQNSSSFQFKN